MVTDSFTFHESAVQDAKKAYKGVQFDDAQRKIIEEAAEILENALGFNNLALKGFMLRAAKKWQQNNNQPIASLAESSPSERIEGVREIINYLRDYLKSILTDPSKSSKLDDAIKEAWAIYLRKYAGRE